MLRRNKKKQQQLINFFICFCQLLTWLANWLTSDSLACVCLCVESFVGPCYLCCCFFYDLAAFRCGGRGEAYNCILGPRTFYLLIQRLNANVQPTDHSQKQKSAKLNSNSKIKLPPYKTLQRIEISFSLFWKIKSDTSVTFVFDAGVKRDPCLHTQKITN